MAVPQNMVTIKIRHRNHYFSALSACFSDFVVVFGKPRKKGVVKLQEIIDALKAMIPGRTEVAIGGVTGTMGALITVLYGEWTNALNALLIAMVIDYVTGVLAAGVSPDRRIDYKVGLMGLAKKTTIFLIIALGHLADTLLGTNLICLAVAYGYLANEGLSIIENAEIIGVPVPSVVRMAYQTIGEKSNIKLGGDTGGAQSTKKP